MSKLSKPDLKRHKEALRLLEKEALTLEDKVFVLENWQEGATHINSAAGAFFTPFGLARDLALSVQGKRIIDLCAGIGGLSFAVWLSEHWVEDLDLTCVEINQEYIEVGKKILPQAKWIHGSIFDLDLGNTYDCAISNPPFGAIKTGRENDGLGGFEFSTIVRASQIAKHGVFLLPQGSTPFKYSGNQSFERAMPDKVQKFIDKTGFEYGFNCGIDTSQYLHDWHGVSPLCEICLFDFRDSPE